MAASFKKTEIRSYPTVGPKITRDTIYWKNLEAAITIKEYGAISHIDFCPFKPHHFAVTSSARVLLYNCRTNKAEKTFSKFKDIAHHGNFRNDGKLLVAGDDDGSVRLFDTVTRSLLRVMKGHTAPVHFTCFTTDNLHIVSGSDDNTVRLWDIASETELTSYSEHKDYVKCGAVSQASKDIVLSGSYDHTVKLYDTRTPSSVLTVNHGSPVEDVLMFPSGSIFITTGGSTIKVWDALAGGRQLTQFSHHHKTITSMCFCSNYKRLVSASLDRHVKIYDISTYQLVHTLDYTEPILSVAVSPDDSTLAVGMANGLLSIQHRKPEQDGVKKKKRVTHNPLLHGKLYTPSQDDVVIEHKRKEQLAKYDKYFKKFEHTKALDAALDVNVRIRTPEVTVSVIQELIRRDGLKQALAGRNNKSLCMVLKFIQKNISNPRFTATLIDITNFVIDIYGSSCDRSSDVFSLLTSTKSTIDEEVNYLKEQMQLLGMMDTLFAVGQTNTSISVDSNSDAISQSDLAKDWQK